MKLIIFCFPPSFRYFPKTKKAAAVFLYNLWTEKDLQSFLKKVSQRSLCLGCVLFIYFFLCRSRLSLVFVRNKTGLRLQDFQQQGKKTQTKASWRSVKESDGATLQDGVFACEVTLETFLMTRTKGFFVFLCLCPAARDVQILLRQRRHHGGAQGGSGGWLSRQPCPIAGVQRWHKYSFTFWTLVKKYRCLRNKKIALC